VVYAQVSYTLAKATNTTEPDGNGIAPNDSNIVRLGEEERGPSVVDQRHRAVITFSYQLPYNLTAGTVTQLASARPFNSVTGIDNNGDGANNDRPVIDGKVVGKSAFLGTGTQDVVVVRGRTAEASRPHHPAAARGLQPFQPRQYPRPGDHDLWRHGHPNAAFGQLVNANNATHALRRWPTSIRPECSSCR
jgi:hypothetical protein